MEMRFHFIYYDKGLPLLIFDPSFEILFNALRKTGKNSRYSLVLDVVD